MAAQAEARLRCIAPTKKIQLRSNLTFLRAFSPLNLLYTSTMHHAQSTRGFTLLEVLIAVMILGIALPILFQLFSGTLRTVKKAKDHAQAVFIAQQKLEELTLMTTPPMELESGDAPNGFAWERTVIPIIHGTNLPHMEEITEETLNIPPSSLYEATVSVTYDTIDSDITTQLHTFLSFTPTSPQPADTDIEDLNETPMP